MPKYSVNSDDDDTSDESATACEMCGDEDADLHTADIAGATLQVCASCAPQMDEPEQSSSNKPEQQDDNNDSSLSDTSGAGEQPTPGYTIGRTDSKHWEEDGTNYEQDPTPYLTDNYAKLVTAARQDAGYTKEEFAKEIGITVAALDAVEAGAAASNGVGGSVVSAIEKELDVSLVDE